VIRGAQKTRSAQRFSYVATNDWLLKDPSKSRVIENPELNDQLAGNIVQEERWRHRTATPGELPFKRQKQAFAG